MLDAVMKLWLCQHLKHNRSEQLLFVSAAISVFMGGVIINGDEKAEHVKLNL